MTLSAVVTTPGIFNVTSSPKSSTGGYFMHARISMGGPSAYSIANKAVYILLRGV